jgi:hypothetical protein
VDLHRDVVFSPELSAFDRSALLAAAKEKRLVRYGDPAPPDVTRKEIVSGRIALVFSLLLGLAVCIFGGVGLGLAAGMAITLVVELAVEMALLPSHFAGGLEAPWAEDALWVSSGIGSVCGLAYFVFMMCHENEGYQDHYDPTQYKMKHVLHRCHNTYVAVSLLPHDFRRLVERAYEAVQRVLDSEVVEAGLLDEIANRTVLPEEVWNIAEGLAMCTPLANELKRIRDLPETPEAEALRGPRRKAVDKAVADATRRVRQLEAYAKKVARADAALAARALAAEDRTRDLTADERYQNLMARTTDRTALTSLDADADILSICLKEALTSGRAIGS